MGEPKFVTDNLIINSAADFLERSGQFAPISEKKIEVIMSTVETFLEVCQNDVHSQKTEVIITKQVPRTMKMGTLSAAEIDGKVAEILDEDHFGDVQTYFQNIQQWLGHVIHIGEGSFTAKLHDLNHPGTYEMGEFEFREIPEGDRDLFKIGAAFYWSLGYSHNKSQLTKESSLRFQRLNNWTEEEYDAAIDKAHDLYNFFSK